MADRIQSSIEVNAAPMECYQVWRNPENFPGFMDHVREVRQELEGKRWHWVIKGPLGKDLEFDSVLDGDSPGETISWHTISEPDVGIQGAVRFEDLGGRTRVTVTNQYETPAGAVGELAGKIFSNPQRMLDDALKNFKDFMDRRVGAAGVVNPMPGTTTGTTGGMGEYGSELDSEVGGIGRPYGPGTPGGAGPIT